MAISSGKQPPAKSSSARCGLPDDSVMAFRRHRLVGAVQVHEEPADACIQEAGDAVPEGEDLIGAGIGLHEERKFVNACVFRKLFRDGIAAMGNHYEYGIF